MLVRRSACVGSLAFLASACGPVIFSYDGGFDGSMDAGGTDAEATRTVTIVLAGDGDGRVTSNPRGIDCPLDCMADFGLSQTVVLTASAAAGSRFRS